ncbi:MAG TPA: type II toxin-antitoxin system VapC family toxin [Terriglobales bacterium]|nr:type II toxin-antitoxin system VapC family toxin [Terriglobales bacterium]
MSKIYWDTMLFVYWLEDHPVHAKRVQQILSKMEERRDQLCTSTFTLGELLAGPYKAKATEIAAKIRDFFKSSPIELIPFTIETAELYGKIRGEQAVSPADAIHLACAAHARTDLFLTNDSALARKVIPGIQFIARMDTSLL